MFSSQIENTRNIYNWNAAGSHNRIRVHKNISNSRVNYAAPVYIQIYVYWVHGQYNAYLFFVFFRGCKGNFCC